MKGYFHIVEKARWRDELTVARVRSALTVRSIDCAWQSQRYTCQSTGSDSEAGASAQELSGFGGDRRADEATQPIIVSDRQCSGAFDRVALSQSCKARVASPVGRYKQTAEQRFAKASADQRSMYCRQNQQLRARVQRQTRATTAFGQIGCDDTAFSLLSQNQQQIEEIISRHSRSDGIQQRDPMTAHEKLRWKQQEYLFNAPVPYVNARQKTCAELLAEHYRAK